MAVFRDRGAIPVLPILRINWARRGWKFYPTSRTWHGWLPFIGRFSKNIRFKDNTEQNRWDHPGPGWLEGKRKRRQR